MYQHIRQDNSVFLRKSKINLQFRGEFVVEGGVELGK